MNAKARTVQVEHGMEIQTLDPDTGEFSPEPVNVLALVIFKADGTREVKSLMVTDQNGLQVRLLSGQKGEVETAVIDAAWQKMTAQYT